MVFVRRTISLVVLVVVLAAAPVVLRAQAVVDKTVAIVGSGTRTQLITYSDLLWQVALERRRPPLDPPLKQDLEQALETLIDQRIFAIEAERLARDRPSETRIAAEIGRLLLYFPPAEFQSRLRQVGFETVQDAAFQSLIAQRLAIEEYVEFRFGSFVVVTSEEESTFYRDTFVPNFRRKSPGIGIPTFEEKRVEIRESLISEKKGLAIEKFLDEAKRRVPVVILMPI